LIHLDGFLKSGELTSWGKGSLSHYLQGFIHPRWSFLEKFSGSMENTQSCCWWVQISTWHRNMGGIAIIAYQIHGKYQWQTVSTRTSSEQKAIQWIQEHIHLTGYNPKLLRKNLDSCIESTWIYIMASLFELFWATNICLHAGNWSNIPDLWICGIDAHRPHSRKSQQYSFRITHCWGWNTTSPPADSMYFTYEAGSICRARSPVDLHSNFQFCSAINHYKSSGVDMNLYFQS